MASSMKVDGYVKQFRGKQDDFPAFWGKFMMVCKIQKWKDDEIAEHLPLFLNGPAYMLWDQLADDDKKDYKKIKAALESAFCMTASEAYQGFMERRFRAGEAVDAYVADLKRLLTLAGHKSSDKDPMLIEKIINGLPAEFCREIRLQCAGQQHTVSQVVEKLRAMMVAVEGSVAQPNPGVGAAAEPGARGRGKPSVLCYHCNQTGHVKKSCPQLRGVQCHQCQQFGHIRRNCPQRFQQPKSDQSQSRASVACKLISVLFTYFTEALRASLQL